MTNAIRIAPNSAAEMRQPHRRLCAGMRALIRQNPRQSPKRRRQHIRC